MGRSAIVGNVILLDERTKSSGSVNHRSTVVHNIYVYSVYMYRDGNSTQFGGALPVIRFVYTT